MDHPANPECQNVGAPIGVRIVVKKTGRIPIQRWALSATGHKNSWLVFLNQKILYSLYFKKYLCNVFHELFFSTVLHANGAKKGSNLKLPKPASFFGSPKRGNAG